MIGRAGGALEGAGGRARGRLGRARRGRGRAVVLMGPPGHRQDRPAGGRRPRRRGLPGAAGPLPGVRVGPRLRRALGPRRARCSSACRAVPAPSGPPCAPRSRWGRPPRPTASPPTPATLSLIGTVASYSPVLIVVDDAHWLDAPTREALAFCARRIEDEPVAILAASRELAARADRHAGRGRAASSPRSARRGRDAARVGHRRGARSPPRSRARCSRWPEGNPLALVELPGPMSGEERAGRAPSPGRCGRARPSPRPSGRRVEGLAPGPRRALVVAAVSADGALGPLTAALGELGGGAEDLVAAGGRGLPRAAGRRARSCATPCCGPWFSS